MNLSIVTKAIHNYNTHSTYFARSVQFYPQEGMRDVNNAFQLKYTYFIPTIAFRLICLTNEVLFSCGFEY